MSFPIYRIAVARYGTELVIPESDRVLALPPGAAVHWSVAGVESGETVELLANSSNPAELGPFTFSRRGSSSVSARGSSGIRGLFEYSLVVYRLGAEGSAPLPVARSGTGSLRVDSLRPRSGQAILVGYDRLPAPRLVVDQLETRIVPGDPLVFEFHLPKDLFPQAWIPSIYFPGTAALPNPGYGPFAALSLVDGVRTESDRDGLIRRYLVATGSSGLVGKFKYLAVVHSADGGQLVSSHDPAIDNDGEVICPGC